MLSTCLLFNPFDDLLQSSLVGNLDRLGLLKDGCNYLEFGAGKGKPL